MDKKSYWALCHHVWSLLLQERIDALPVRVSELCGHLRIPIKQTANMFAARLLAPACVLWGCGVRSAADIMRLCDISEQSAEYRWARMQELYKRGKFLTHPLERAVYEQFSDYIRANKL